MIKPGVSVTGLSAEMALAFAIVQAIFHARGHRCVITGGTDEAAPARQTYEHRTGRGLDIRTWDCGAEAERKTLAALCKEALGRDYQVILERLGGIGEHLHLGHRPRA